MVKYPFVIVVGLVIIAGIIIYVFKNRTKIKKYRTGSKVANTDLIKKSPVFQKRYQEYRILMRVAEISLIFSLILGLVLIARPTDLVTQNQEEHNRDILLCMDVSGSVESSNQKIIQSMQKIVAGLDGERISVSIFNSSSILLSPLTEDYDYILEVLDSLNRAIAVAEKPTFDDDDWFTEEYIYAGTMEREGASLIGDGLATCVYSFPKLGTEDRTRIIIFSTDNDVMGDQLVTLPQAAALAKKYQIYVYGIATESMIDSEAKEMKNAVEGTGGAYYTEASSADDIISEIEKTSKSLRKKAAETAEVDAPVWPFSFMVILLAIFIILDWRLQ